MTTSIYELMDQVRRHPDYVYGTVWTKEDVADAIRDDRDTEPTPEEIAAVTDDMVADAECALENYVFSGAYSWAEAIADNVTVPEAA